MARERIGIYYGEGVGVPNIVLGVGVGVKNVVGTSVNFGVVYRVGTGVRLSVGYGGDVGVICVIVVFNPGVVLTGGGVTVGIGRVGERPLNSAACDRLSVVFLTSIIPTGMASTNNAIKAPFIMFEFLLPVLSFGGTSAIRVG